LRKVKAAAAVPRQRAAMFGESRPARFVAGRTLCTGPAAAPHAPVEIVPEAGRAITCPACGQRYRLIERAPSIDPAAWPRED
jgi:hypothetical protein